MSSTISSRAIARLACLIAAVALAAGCGEAGRTVKVTEAKPMKTRVVHEGAKTWVAGVPVQQGKNSVLSALASVLQAQGEDVTYEYLMGVSSHAFRMQFSWCPSAPHSNCGFNTVVPALKAVGYTLADYPMRWPDKSRAGREEADVARAREALKHSIDAGRPAIAGSEESGIVVGYEPAADGAAGLIVRSEKDGEYSASMKELPWGLAVLGAKSSPPPRRELLLWSLRTAVANAHAAELSSANGAEGRVLRYPAGFVAWDKWIAELSDEKKSSTMTRSGKPLSIEELDKDEWFGVAIGNAWCYESLVDARTAAAAYLRSIAGEFKPAAAAHLLKAAEAYDGLVAALKPGLREIRYPWTVKTREEWSKPMRLAEAECLRQALPFERQAIDAIEKALAAEGN